MLDYQVDNMYVGDGYDSDESEFLNEFGSGINRFTEIRNKDKGLNFIKKRVVLNNGKIKNKRIKVYTSNGTGNQIRDGETGEYYNYKVGSKDELLFFKVALATGQCNSANGSNTLFYYSPEHYENHMHSTVDPEQLSEWYYRHDIRLAEIVTKTKSKLNTNFNTTVVH